MRHHGGTGTSPPVIYTSGVGGLVACSSNNCEQIKLQFSSSMFFQGASLGYSFHLLLDSICCSFFGWNIWWSSGSSMNILV